MSAPIQYALLDALAVELGWTEWHPEDWPHLVAEVAELVRLREQAAEVGDAMVGQLLDALDVDDEDWHGGLAMVRELVSDE